VQLEITHPAHLIIPSKRERIMYGLSTRHTQQRTVLTSCVGLPKAIQWVCLVLHLHLGACSLTDLRANRCQVKSNDNIRSVVATRPYRPALG
jgi:hypothetical protein